MSQGLQAQLQESALGTEATTVVLVEGLSDYFAITVLAARCGLAVHASSFAVVPMGGAGNLGRFLRTYGPRGRRAKLVGLCDVAEEPHFSRQLERGGLGEVADRERLEALGFFVCVNDLEEELIRSLGCDATEQIIEAEGETRSLERLSREPFHRDRSREQRLHRFMGVRSGRKYRYARLMAEALDLRNLPPPLAGVLGRI